MPIEIIKVTIPEEHARDDIKPWDEWYAEVGESDSEEVTRQLIEHINNNEPEELSKLLDKDFIIEKNSVINLEKNNERSITTTVKKQPILEYLLLTHPDKLLEIINALIAQSDSSLFQIFEKNLKHHDLLNNLFSWTPAMKAGVEHEIEKIKAHVKTLETTDTTRHALIENLHADLNGLLSRAPKTSTTLETNQPVAFNILRFKLEIAERQHRDYSELSTHRGSRWFFANLGNVLFGISTLGIANLISKGITHQWEIFSTKTTSTTRIDKVDRTLGLDSERFSAKATSTAKPFKYPK